MSDWLAGFLLIVGTLIVNLAFLAVAVWVVVEVLQATGAIK